MLKLLPIALFLFDLVLAASPPPSPPETVCTASSTAGRIEMRAEPGQSGKRIQLPGSAKMVRIDTASQTAGDWIQIEASGKKGWVPSERLVCHTSETDAKVLISADAARVLTALHSRNLRELSRFVHPVKGVRFSPYAFVDKSANVKYNAVDIQHALLEKSARVWGSYDGSGDPIRLTFSDYFKRFVDDRDFEHSKKMSYNGAAAVKGTTRDNSRQEYPNAIIFESHVAGTAAEQEGMDWRALRLVFEQYRGRWYLVHVIHDQWTI